MDRNFRNAESIQGLQSAQVARSLASVRFSVISSGSRANCTYIETARTKLLVDCGLSAAQLERRITELGLHLSGVDAILVTHEHRDHLYGISTVSRRYRIPVYANSGARPYLGTVFGVEPFKTGVPFSVGDIDILPVPLPHDATDPVGFVFQSGGLKFSHITDLGWVTPQVRDALTMCHAFVLESNHDEDMLASCRYPWPLKERIRSKLGHLSNGESAALIRDVQHPDLQHVVLGHLSENSNNHTVALTAHQEIIGELPFSLRCASVRSATPLIAVDGTPRRVTPKWGHPPRASQGWLAQPLKRSVSG